MKKQTSEIVVFDIFIDPSVDAIQPQWWHKFIFWKKWKYSSWIINREFMTLDEIKERRKE